jgi:uncharacterized RDD family membrane protein YckC
LTHGRPAPTVTEMQAHLPAASPSYAGVGTRFLATLVDVVVVGIIVAPLADTTVDRTSGLWIEVRYSGGASVGAWLIGIAYFTLMEGTIGATVGKLLVGLRVRGEDGAAAGLGRAFVRNLLRVIDALPYALPYLLGAILVWASPTRQRLGDRIANTVVINHRSRPSPAPAPTTPAPAWSAPVDSPGRELPPPPPGTPPRS